LKAYKKLYNGGRTENMKKRLVLESLVFRVAFSFFKFITLIQLKNIMKDKIL